MSMPSFCTKGLSIRMLGTFDSHTSILKVAISRRILFDHCDLSSQNVHSAYVRLHTRNVAVTRISDKRREVDDGRKHFYSQHVK